MDAHGPNPVRNDYSYKFFGTFRLLLAITVVVSHLQANFSPPWIREILTPLGIGNIGVVMFFVLSGYVISEALTVFYAGRLKKFLVNRCLRILPPFILALLFSYAIHLVCYGLELPIYEFQNSQQWLSSLNLRQISINFLSVFDFRIPAARENYHLYVRYIWAVVTEVQFYVAAGLLFWIGRSLVAEPFARRQLFVICVFITAGLYLLSIVIKFPPVFKLIEFSPYFLMGVCFFYLNRDATNKSLGILHVCTALALALSFVCFARYTKYNLFALLAFGFSMLCFVRLASYKTTAKPLLRKVDSFLGDLSYPVYLNHGSVEVLLYGFFQGISMLVVWLGVALSLVVSWVLNSVIEPITRELRDRIRGQVLVR
jgi:peptidoglycan/LPS O-acetylase OafA/YrhL